MPPRTRKSTASDSTLTPITSTTTRRRTRSVANRDAPPSPSHSTPTETDDDDTAIDNIPTVAFTSLSSLLKQASLPPYIASILIVVFAIWVRWAVGLGPFSGKGVQPLHGDFEAQRHWGEITAHLSPSKWYFYDLNYWGLDYPPLTAYHSYVLGKIGSWINPSWFALDKSRGIETQGVKDYMRASAIVSELVVYVPAVYLLVQLIRKSESVVVKNSAFFLILMQPALIIIDHGHFQYNAVMLGLTTAAIYFFTKSQYLLGSIAFVSALCFKQMALYYALPVFFFLLGKCFRKDQKWTQGGLLLVQLGVTVLVTFAIYLAPFLSSWTQLQQVFIRVFPVQRGLYEDKVANVWCAISIVLKLREWFSLDTLVKMSALTTLLGCAPSCWHVFRFSQSSSSSPSSPSTTLRTLLYALLNSSLAFFLFSFQVHEKTILIPLLPATLLLILFNLNNNDKLVLLSFMNVSMFSMYPLLIRDKVLLQYWVIILMWNWFFAQDWKKCLSRRDLLSTIIMITHIGMILIHGLWMAVTPPSRLPHLWIMANVLWSCAAFGGAWVYFHARQFGVGVKGSTEKKGKRL